MPKNYPHDYAKSQKEKDPVINLSSSEKTLVDNQDISPESEDIRQEEGFWSGFERLIPFLAIALLVAGVLIGLQGITWLIDLAQSIVSQAVHGLIFVGPVLVGLSVAASIAELTRKNMATTTFKDGVIWFFVIRVISALFTIAIIALIFRSPLLPAHIDAFSFDQLSEVFGNITFGMLMGSIGFAVITGWIGSKQDRLYKLLQAANNGLDKIGNAVSILIPLVMFTLGLYISGLDKIIVGEAAKASIAVQNPLFLYALSLVVTLILIGFGWQIVFLYSVIRNRNDVTIKSFFAKYYQHVYPLAWASMSEIATFPLSLSKARHAFPKMNKDISSVVLSLGIPMNVTGNMINGFIIAGFVSSALGYHLSVLEMLLVVPVISVVSLGEVGIPGDSILMFGLVMVAMMAVPVGFMTNFKEVFLALWLILEVGLQDSFRTGINVTDNAISALLFDNYYKRGKDVRTGLVKDLKNSLLFWQ